MSEASPPTPIFLHDYRPPLWRAPTTRLCFELGTQETLVECVTRYELADTASTAAGGPLPELFLDGRDLELLEILIDDKPCDERVYQVEKTGLRIFPQSSTFKLRTHVRIHPETNKALEGLYLSGGTFCTQMEAEGFRRVTYFQDRPDVLSVFETTIIADAKAYPVLLSNGEQTASKSLAGGRHARTWHDPFPKPCYLFALVAGNLHSVRDTFTTHTGREVELLVWVDPGNEGRAAFALEALVRAMRWDERAYGREYDLGIFQIVAIRDFNLGAMENKSLNIFNEALVLADTKTATDSDFQRIESVIGHEYFHNWSGNRVTCRDWFQLSLKEGFTVFRDQQFSASLGSEALQRIQDVQALRGSQFIEDSGPRAHPVRPQSYIKIDNFYTATVYEKGAELIRMMHTAVGPEVFRQGSDLYFERHDGQAVRTEDFLAAICDAAKAAGLTLDLRGFQRWYDQAGTPELWVEEQFDGSSGDYTLRFRQATPPTPGQNEKLPVPIPVRAALFDREGQRLSFKRGETNRAEHLLYLTETEHAFTFGPFTEKPVPSLLRAFSAPVALRRAHRETEEQLLASCDDDLFNRWEVGQRIAHRAILKRLPEIRESRRAGSAPVALDEILETVWGANLRAAIEQGVGLARRAELAFFAELLALPTEIDLALSLEELAPVSIHRARTETIVALGLAFEAQWETILDEIPAPAADQRDGGAVGARAIRNLALHYLVATGKSSHRARAWDLMRSAETMTEELASFRALYHYDGAYRSEAKERFRDRFANNALVMNKWLSVCASSPVPHGDATYMIEGLTREPFFDAHNPNNLRSLYRSFCHNAPYFHNEDGTGYALLATALGRIDRFNPIMAGRLAENLQQWRKLIEPLRTQAKEQLEAILRNAELSENTYEVVSRMLA